MMLNSFFCNRFNVRLFKTEYQRKFEAFWEHCTLCNVPGKIDTTWEVGCSIVYNLQYTKNEITYGLLDLFCHLCDLYSRNSECVTRSILFLVLRCVNHSSS